MKTTPVNLLFSMKEAYSRFLDPVCKEFELNHMELLVLLYIKGNPENDTAADIVKTGFFSKSHVSGAVTKLEKEGYIERVLRGGNRKSYHLQLLNKADAPVKAGEEAQKEFEKTLFAGLSGEDSAVLKNAADLMNDNLRNYIKD